MERSKSIISIVVGLAAILIIWRVGFHPLAPEQSEEPGEIVAAEPNKPGDVNEPLVTFDVNEPRRVADANAPTKLAAVTEANEPAEPNGPMEFVNLKSVEMKNIIEKLAKWTGKVIIPTDEAMKQKITIYAPDKLPRSKALAKIYSALRLRGFIARETDDEIILEAIGDAKLGRVPTIGADEPLALIENKEQVVQKFFELTSYSSSEMGSVVQPLIGEHGHVSVDETTGTLMVIDTVANLMRLERIIQQFDVPGAEQTVTDIIEVRYGDPSEIVQMLNILLGETQGISSSRHSRDQRGDGRGSSSRSAPQPSNSSKKPSGSSAKKPDSKSGAATSVVVGTTRGPVVLIPEQRRKWIIAKASAEDMKLIREWVEKLDKKEEIKKEYETVQLGYADPSEVAMRLNEAIQQMPGTKLQASILIQPLTQARQIMIFGREELREMVKKLVAEIDIPSGLFETRVFHLEYADADKIKENLEGLYEQEAGYSYSSSYGRRGYSRTSRNVETQETVKIIAFPTMRQVTVIASSENMLKIAKQIKEWDVPLDLDQVKPRIITLRNSDPVQMANLLTTLFSEEADSGRRSLFRYFFGGDQEDKKKIVGPLYGQLTFEEVPGTKKIIVISNVAGAYSVIEELVKELDSQDMAETPHVITLKYADPEDLSERLNALFVKPGQQARIRYTAQGLTGESVMDESADSSSTDDSQAQQGTYTPPWSGQGARMGIDEEMPISNVIGRVRFIPEPHTKSIMVLSPPEFIDAIETMISELDVPGKQVVIEAIIVEVEHTKVTSLGVELATNPAAFGSVGENALVALSNLTNIGTHGSASGIISPGAGTFEATGSGSVLGVGTDVYALVDFLIKTTDAKILNQQTLWTKDNEQANFFKGTKVAFLGGTTLIGGQGGSQQNVEFDDVGMELRARPSITPEDNVDMIVNVEISQLTSDLVNDQPVRSLMNTTTNMIVKDGQTLLLGGILFQKDSTIERKLPLLGDIPLIGGLFRHNQVIQSNSELLVFITPRVIEAPTSELPELPEAIEGSQEKLDEIREQLDTTLSKE